ncbi:MAG: zinc-binding dehydrogenase, partial [Spirochaetaceae bacterium]|nr:zinc-binding dehydrogenase [Spirochaetaceae bacterium]
DKIGSGVDSSLEGCTVVGDNIMPDGREVGFELTGGYASHFITRAENLVILPDSVNPAHSTLIEPLAVCLRGFNKVKELFLSDIPADVLIFGDGPIGLLQIMLARQAGAGKITVVGGRASRLNLAKSLGADVIVNYRETANLTESIRITAETGNWPLIIESSGNPVGLNAAIELGSDDARILILGDYSSEQADFKWNRVLHKELHLIGSNTGTGAWAQAGRLSTELKLAPLVTHKFPAADFQAALQTVKDRTSGAVKVVLEWE